MQFKPTSQPGVLPGSRTTIWPRFTVTTKDPNRDLTVEMDVVVNRWGRGRCNRLEVGVPEGGSVSGELLRTIPVARLVRAAVAEAGSFLQFENELPGGGARFSGLDTPQRIATSEKLMRDAQPRRGSPITDDHLREVAKVYRDALDQGEPPTQTICKEWKAKRATASKWVAKARERGFLGPAKSGRASA